MLVLASTSATRRDMLTRAGVKFEVSPPTTDEVAFKAQFRSGGGDAGGLAMGLAIAKALSVSVTRPEDLVIGADQVMQCDDRQFDKPKDIAEAKGHLRRLSGRTHALVTAVACARAGTIIWHAQETTRMTMRRLSDNFIDAYVEQEGDAVLSAVGAYLIESRGAQLFETIDGSYFGVLGLPLLPLMAFLRQEGELPS